MIAESRKGLVVVAYEAAYPDRFVLRTGDRVKIGHKKSEWSGWLWCTDGNGNSRWIPESYVARDNDTGRMLRDYDSTELSVAVGEELTVLQQESGWFWCTNQSGQSGWVPAANVQVT